MPSTIFWTSARRETHAFPTLKTRTPRRFATLITPSRLLTQDTLMLCHDCKNFLHYETSESLHRGQTANERHPWLTKPVGLNSLWRDDPAGIRTPDSVGTSSDCEVSLLLHEDRRIWTKHPTTSATTPGAPMLLSLPAIAKTGVPSKANYTIRMAPSL